jgi:PEP-CTERM motif
VYSGSVSLRGLLLSSTTPQTTTPETFPSHLGLLGVGPVNPFNFGYGVCLGVGPFGSDADACTDATGPATQIVDYVGTATLRETTSPVPEPASVLLVGSGLAMFRACQKRRARA